MSDNTLKVPTLLVKLADRDQAEQIPIPNGIQIRWDMERARQRWPGQDEAPTLWAGWCTWVSAKRMGLVDKQMPFEAWQELVEVMAPGDTETVDPTPPAHDHD